MMELISHRIVQNPFFCAFLWHSVATIEIRALEEESWQQSTSSPAAQASLAPIL